MRIASVSCCCDQSLSAHLSCIHTLIMVQRGDYPLLLLIACRLLHASHFGAPVYPRLDCPNGNSRDRKPEKTAKISFGIMTNSVSRHVCGT